VSDATPSRWEDYLDVFIAPARLFERRSDGKFGQGFLVFMALFLVLFFATKTAMQPIFDAEISRGMAMAAKQNPNLTPEQLAQGRAFAGTATSIFPIVLMPIIIFLLGAAVWLAGKTVGGKLNYAQGTTIAVFAMFPRLLDTVSGALQALLLDESRLNSRWSVSLGPGRLFNPDAANGVLLAMVGRLDVFTLWITVLVGVGLKVVARVPAAQAAAGAAIVWVIGGLPTFIQALRAG
jgi:hypothetical protein